MGIREENTKRIQELEDELSNEKIAEIFWMDAERSANVSGRKRRAPGRTVLRRILAIALPVACIVVIAQFFSPVFVTESTMGETIAPRDCVVVARYAYSMGEVRFADIIAYGASAAGDKELYGRVIGLPGDKIEIRDGSVFRNDIQLYEPYTTNGRTDGMTDDMIVPEGCYFVLGDDRAHGYDSRDESIGYVRKGEIRGKVVYRLLPASRAGPMQTNVNDIV